MNTFTVYLARTGQRQQVMAKNSRAALVATGRPDACLVDTQADGAIDVTFGPSVPTIITTRFNAGEEAERLTFALATVVNHLDNQTRSTPRTIQNGGWVSAMDLASDTQRRRKVLRRLSKEGQA